jgi:hypothetical protein
VRKRPSTRLVPGLVALTRRVSTLRYYVSLVRQPVAERQGPCHVHLPTARALEPARADRRVDGRTRRHRRPWRNHTVTGIRHFTASAVVFDDHQNVLLFHDNKLGQ